MGRSYWEHALKYQKEFWSNQKVQKRHKDRGTRIKYWYPYQSLFLKYVTLNGTEKMLDVGCGPTGILVSFQSGKRYGVDPLIRFFREKYKMPVDIEYVEGISERLPFKYTCFDVVFIFNLLDQIENPFRTIREVRRVLKKQGHLFCGVDTFDGLTYLKDRIKNFYGRQTGTCGHHTQSFSKEKFENLLRSNGFDILYSGIVASGRVGESVAICKK